MDLQLFDVRTGEGTVKRDGTFTDVVERVQRAVRQHSGWQSVTYKGKRYQLHGGNQTFWFISLKSPLRGKASA